MVRSFEADALNEERLLAIKAEQEIEHMREELPRLARLYAQGAFKYKEPDIDMRVGFGRWLVYGWRFGATTRNIWGKPTRVDLYIDEEGSLHQLYSVRSRLPLASARRIHRQIRPSWSSPVLVRACYEALTKSTT